MEYLIDLPEDLALNSDQHKTKPIENYDRVFDLVCVELACEQQPLTTPRYKDLNDLCLHFCRHDLCSVVLSQPRTSPITVNLLPMSQFTSYQEPSAQRQWQLTVHFLNLYYSALPRCKR